MNERNFQHAIRNTEQTLILAALAALQEKAAIQGSLVESEAPLAGKYQPDGTIDLVYEQQTTRFLVECKSAIDRKAQIDQVHRQLESAGAPGLLIAPYLSKELAEHCRARELQFIDTCGNAYLRAPGMFILITGEKGERGQASLRAPRGLTNAAALRVVFALLAQPALVNAPFKDIANQAGVSLGTAYNVLEDLERRGYLIKGGSADRRSLLERRRLLDEWVINYPSTLRAKLQGKRYTAPDPLWWKNSDLLAFGAAWGSEVGANKMTGHLKPATQTIYVQPADMESLIRTLVKQHRIRPDPNGEIEILEKFWHWETGTATDIAPPLLVYSELLALLDPRASETADMIKEKFIEPALDQG